MWEFTTVTLLCVTSLFISNANTYILLAANLEDLKSLAKKYVSEMLVKQLANMVTSSTAKYTLQPVFEDESDGTEYEDNSENYTDPEDNKFLAKNLTDEETKMKPFLMQIFEEIVQKVKDRLEHDSIRKSTITPSHLYNAQQIHDHDDEPENTNQNMSSNEENLLPVEKKPLKSKENSSKVKHTERHPKKDRPYENDDYTSIYIKQDLNNDYRNENAEDPGKQQSKTQLKNKRYEEEDPRYVCNGKGTNTVQDVDNDKITKLNHDASKKTMTPKRHAHKMSSPNLEKLPIVAEKYDFTEPLPEKDREQKKLKQILSVERFAINGKIKLQE